MTSPTTQELIEQREWLIRKDGYFYRPNCQGYTTSKFEAGRYTRSKAEAEAAVEPWHMKAIHQDDWPDDAPSASVKSLEARLAQLEAERDRQYDENVTLIMEKAQLEAENEALRQEVLAVMEPFAKVASNYRDDAPDDYPADGACTNIGDLRAVCALRDRLKGG